MLSVPRAEFAPLPLIAGAGMVSSTLQKDLTNDLYSVTIFAVVFWAAIGGNSLFQSAKQCCLILIMLLRIMIMLMPMVMMLMLMPPPWAEHAYVF